MVAVAAGQYTELSMLSFFPINSNLKIYMDHA